MLLMKCIRSYYPIFGLRNKSITRSGEKSLEGYRGDAYAFNWNARKVRKLIDHLFLE